MNTIKFIIPKDADDYNDFRGIHATCPITPDDTLCGVAISDNYNCYKSEASNKKPTCERCLEIIKYCKQF